jgi:hypothetical protein
VGAPGQLLTANDAQAWAVVPAERRDRLCQNDGIADLVLQIELMVVRQAQGIRSVGRLERQAAGQVDAGQSFLVEIDLDRPLDLAQAPGAGLGDCGREPATDEQTPVRPAQPQLALEIAALDQIGPEVQRRRRDGDVPDRPYRLRQEPGNVEDERLSRGLVVPCPIGRIRRALPDRRYPARPRPRPPPRRRRIVAHRATPGPA